MHRVFVEERKWIDEARFQHMLAFCMLLPGPEAQQLATYVGWRLRGSVGALIAGWLFVAPGALIVLALSWLYVNYGTLPSVAAAFDGVKCAVLALVVEALVKVGKRALKTRVALLIALAAFLALMLGAPFPLVIVAAGLVGFFRATPRDVASESEPCPLAPRDREAIPRCLVAGRRAAGGGRGKAGLALAHPLARPRRADRRNARDRAHALPDRAVVFGVGLRDVRRRLRGAGVSRGGGCSARLDDAGADDRWTGARRNHAGAAHSGQRVRRLLRWLGRGRAGACACRRGVGAVVHFRAFVRVDLRRRALSPSGCKTTRARRRARGDHRRRAWRHRQAGAVLRRARFVWGAAACWSGRTARSRARRGSGCWAWRSPRAWR